MLFLDKRPFQIEVGGNWNVPGHCWRPGENPRQLCFYFVKGETTETISFASRTRLSLASRWQITPGGEFYLVIDSVTGGMNECTYQAAISLLFIFFHLRFFPSISTQNVCFLYTSNVAISFHTFSTASFHWHTTFEVNPTACVRSIPLFPSFKCTYWTVFWSSA